MSLLDPVRSIPSVLGQVTSKMAAAPLVIRDPQSGIRSAVMRMSCNDGKETFGALSLPSRQLSIFINISVVVSQVNLTFSEKASCHLSLHIRVNFLNHLDETWQLLPHSVVLCEHVLFLLQDCNHLLELWLYLATWKDPTAWVRLCVHACVLYSWYVLVEWMDLGRNVRQWEALNK